MRSALPALSSTFTSRVLYAIIVVRWRSESRGSRDSSADARNEGGQRSPRLRRRAQRAEQALAARARARALRLPFLARRIVGVDGRADRFACVVELRTGDGPRARAAVDGDLLL